MYDLIIIGGGPAGYAAAIRAGQKGKKVVCVEQERPGGTCLNWGCIPTKTIVTSAEVFATVAKSKSFGILCDEPQVDFAQIMARSRRVVDTLARGMDFLFKKNKVESIEGRARIETADTVTVIKADNTMQTLQGKAILIATGGLPKTLPNLVVDGKQVFTSRELLAAKKMPASMIILGGGSIGVECAYYLNALGCKVTLVEMLPHILPLEDAEIAAALTRSFQRQGMTVLTNTKAENIAVSESGVSLDLVGDNKKANLQAEALLVAVGVRANTENLFGENFSLKLDAQGFIAVDEHYQTSVKNVFAAGDVIGAPLLAHVATFEGLQALKGILGEGTPKRVDLFPSCVYCHPQVASVGKNEEALKREGIEYRVGKFPFSASAKAVILAEPEGFIKILTDTTYGEILGAHIVGSGATELIAEYALAMQAELTVDDIHATIHGHPTFAEAGAEAAASVRGSALLI